MAEDRDEKLGRVEERITKYYFYQTTFTIKHRIYIYHFSMEHRSLPPGNVNVKNFPRTNNNRHLLDNHRCNVSASKENLPLSSDLRRLNLYTVDRCKDFTRTLLKKKSSRASKIERKQKRIIFSIQNTRV